MSQQKWFYLNASLDKVGPMTSQALKSLADNGIIVPTTTLIAEDGSGMVEAGSLKGLFSENYSPPQSPPIRSVSTNTSTSSTGQGAPPSISQKSQLRNPDPPPSTHRFTSNSAWNLPPPVSEQASTPLSQQSTASLASSLPTSRTAPDPWDAIASTHQTPSPFEKTPPWESSGVFPASLQSSGTALPNPQSRHVRNHDDRMQQLLITAGVLFVVWCILGIVSVNARNHVFSAAGIDEDPSRFSVSSLVSRKPAPELPKDASDSSKASPDRQVFTSPPRKPVVFTESASPTDRKANRATEEIVAEVENSIALISGKEGSGTGFVVMPGIIATNSHVIAAEEIADLEVLFPSESGPAKGPFRPQLLYEDADRDLAFLQIKSLQHHSIPTVDNYKFRRGQKVIVIGNPGRGDGEVLQNAVCEGILSTQTEVDDKHFYQLSIAVNPGNSGGPVLDGDGCAIGVVTLKATKIEGTAYCIPPEELNKGIETVRKKDSTQIEKHRATHAAMTPFFRGLGIVLAFEELPESKKLEFAKKAVDEFSEAIKRLPDNGLAFFFRGLFRVVLGSPKEGLADLDEAIRLLPEKTELVGVRDELKKEIDRHSSFAGRGRPSSLGPGMRFPPHFRHGFPGESGEESIPSPPQSDESAGESPVLPPGGPPGGPRTWRPGGGMLPPRTVPSAPMPPKKRSTFFDETPEK